MIDLQNHTVASDGELTPEELIDLAIKKKLSAIAITDHDSIGSVKKAIGYSKGKNIEIVSGIELSCDDPLFDYDKIDVLGLFIDVGNKKLNDLIGHINNKREENKKQTIEKLSRLGYNITYEDVKKSVKGAFGRPHIAKYLIKKYPDKFSSVNDVFNKLLGKGKAGFIQTSGRVSIKDAVKIIQSAGGLAMLAHPGICPREKSLSLIDYFIENGGDGIETYYPYHIICPELKIGESGNKKIIDFYRKVAKSKKILESGGNDHHDKYRPTLGEVKIPEEVLENLKKKIKDMKKNFGKTKEAWTIWFTGLHGSGKSTIAKGLADFLGKKNINFSLLDGDELRKTISADLGYTLKDRNKHMRRVANLCMENSKKEILSIASVASPTEESREYARKILKNIFVVYVKCPLEVCAKRDIKGHYKKAGENARGFENFMKVSLEFEEPKNPDIILNTDKESVEGSVSRLIKKLESKGVL